MNKKERNSNRDSLEHHVVRGNLFTHSAIGRNSERINEIESFLYGLIDLMIEKGELKKEKLIDAAKEVRKEMFEKGELAHAGIGIRVDKPEEVLEPVPVNCNERLHICEAICCKLNFALSVEEIESGKVKWDLGKPYFIRHEKHGYCSHLNLTKNCCSVYNDRPSVCRKYSCAHDKRIWKDFEKMELNTEWIEENLKEQRIQLTGLFMIPEEKIEYAPKTE